MSRRRWNLREVWVLPGKDAAIKDDAEEKKVRKRDFASSLRNRRKGRELCGGVVEQRVRTSSNNNRMKILCLSGTAEPNAITPPGKDLDNVRPSRKSLVRIRPSPGKDHYEGERTFGLNDLRIPRLGKGRKENSAIKRVLFDHRNLVLRTSRCPIRWRGEKGVGTSVRTP